MKNLKVHLKIENYRLYMVAQKEGDLFALPEYSNELSIHSYKIAESCVYLVLEQNSDEKNWIEVSTIAEFISNHGSLLLSVIASFYSFMPNSLKGLVQFIPREFLKISLREKLLADGVEEVTFYGGSFNPWHEGHSECLRQCPAGEIVIVPDCNPWKNPKESSQCLWRSFKEIANRFENSRYSLFPGFWVLDKTNPTVEWLPKVEVKRKNFLMGDDNFFSLRKWTNASTLISALHTVYVVPRFYKRSEIEDYKKDFNKDYAVNVAVLSEHSFQGLSSTEIRKSEGLS